MNFWWSEELFFISNVPVSDIIDVEVAHVVSIYLVNRLASSFDLSSEDILLFPSRRIYIKDTIQVILFVSKLQATCQLMWEISHEYIVEQVFVVVVTDYLAIFELNLFEAFCINDTLCQSWLDWKG